MKGQEKGDLLIEVTSWAGLTVYGLIISPLHGPSHLTLTLLSGKISVALR